MQAQNGHFYEFRSFRLDLAERQLLHEEKPISLTPKAFDVLVVLVERAGHLVEKEELMELVWPDSHVEEANVARLIHTLRRALGQDDNGNQFIDTVPTKGYRFVAPVVIGNDDGTPKALIDTVGAERLVRDTPPGVAPLSAGTKRTAVIFALSAVLLLGLGSYFLVSKGLAPRTDDRRSIAVLPFVNDTGDSSQDYLVDGVAENVMNNLSRLSGLKVTSRSAVFDYKGKLADLRKIAGDLHVDAVILGEVKTLDHQLIINVNLVDPNDGSQIWGKQFIKNSLDAVATPNEIAQAVAQNLRVNLTDADRRSLGKLVTENEEAFRFYLKAQALGQQNSPDALNRSIAFYQQAIDKDHDFALAYSEMGMRYVNLGIYFMPPREVMPKARDSAEKALQMDSTLSDPHTILGLVSLLYDWDWDKAKSELSEGEMVNLRSIETFNCSAHLLQMTGRAVDADESLRSALKNEPLSISLATELGCNSYYAGRIDQSIDEYRNALVLKPDNFMAVYGLTRSLNHKKQYADAIHEIDKVNDFMPMVPPIATSEKAYALAKLGDRSQAEAQIKVLEEQSTHFYVDPFFMAIAYLGLEDKEQTFVWLENAYNARSSLIPSLVRDSKWDVLRSDERFQNLLQRIGSTR